MSLVLCACMVFSMLNVSALATGLQSSEVTTFAQDWTGYTAITDKTDLYAVRNNLDGKYYLTADITFTEEDFSQSGAFYNSGAGWVPIGNTETPFTGEFDGNGHSITGLQINVKSTASETFGLFGYSTGVIKNLSLLDSSIVATFTGSSSTSARCYAASICAYLEGGKIEHCQSSASVTCESTGQYFHSYAGGIAAYVDSNGVIADCQNKGDVFASADGIAYSGGIAAYGRYATVTGCYNEGTVEGNRYAGGIIGNDYENTVANCSNAGEVNASYNAGGIVGYKMYGTIDSCYNTGYILSSSTVTANSTLASAYAGGICGESSRCTIANCYNTGLIESTNVSTHDTYAAGISGKNSGDIDCCYNVGSLKSSDYVAGIWGYYDSWNGGSFANCYYLNSCSQGTVEKADTAVKCTKDQLTKQETFVGFDFDDTWQMGNSAAHPFPELVSNKHSGAPSLPEDTVNFGGGNGTMWCPYKISTKEHLNNIRDHLTDNEWFILVNDIAFTDSDFSEYGAFYNGGQGWDPLGSDANNSFTGVLDGNGYSISGLKINTTSESDLYLGLIGYCQGTICDLRLEDISITGTLTGATNTIWAGGICGYLSAGSIEGCTVSGTITAYETCVESTDKSASIVGGIVGESNNGAVISCNNSAEVSAYADSRDTSSGGGSWATSAKAGGIVAKTTGAISESYNTGNISAEASGNYATSSAGGITAYSKDEISLCYNTGSVQALGNPNNYAGGIVASFSNATISYCYNSGRISSDGSAGGASGYLSSSSISQFYNIGEVSCPTASYHYAGAVAGYSTSGTISGCYYMSSNVGAVGKSLNTTSSATELFYEDAQIQSSYKEFDFEEVWKMSCSPIYPFPELRTVPHKVKSPYMATVGTITLEYVPYDTETVFIAAYKEGKLLSVISGTISSSNDVPFATDADEIKIFFLGDNYRPVSAYIFINPNCTN